MKTLLLMRHAKSDWSATFDRDEARPLNERGRRAAARVGEWLTKVGAVPDRVVSSPAVRTRTTAERAVEAGGWQRTVALDEDIYDANPATLMRLMSSTPEDVRTLLLVGHEPGMSGTVAHLLGGAAVRFPTAAVARIDLDIERWVHLETGCGLLVWFVTPRLLGLAEED